MRDHENFDQTVGARHTAIRCFGLASEQQALNPIRAAGEAAAAR